MHALIDQRSQVLLHFSLALEDGVLVDSTFDKDPASFTMGDGSLLPHFEALLIGLQQGDERVFTLTPERAFGVANPNNLQCFERRYFAHMTLEMGSLIAFSEGEGGERYGVVRSISDAEVAVDFNHPLAGRLLRFEVRILEVRGGDPCG